MKTNKSKLPPLDKLNDIITSLESSPFVKCGKLPSELPKRSIVAFYVGNRLIHLGTSKNTRRYIKDACFHPRGFLPLRLAKIKYGTTKASNKTLLSNRGFIAIFKRERERLQKAKARILAVEDEVKSNMVKAAATLLGVPHLAP